METSWRHIGMSLQWQERDLGASNFFLGTHNRRARGNGQEFGLGTQGLLTFFLRKVWPLKMSYFDSSINQPISQSIKAFNTFPKLCPYSRYFMYVMVVCVWSRCDQ